MYEPKPIDTSDVVLPAELLALTEKLPKTFMKCGPQAELPKVGLTVKRRTTI